MPELPEVENIVREIKLKAINREVSAVWQSAYKMRSKDVSFTHDAITHTHISGCQRRGKYIILSFGMQHLLMHLGMSGRIYIDLTTPPRLDKHEHLQIHFADGGVLRFIDPRRFGTVSFVPHNNWQSHPLISSLGPEPLTEDFSPQILWQKCQKSSIPIKIFIMQSHIVVGVGNIYASEALFYANINPAQAANSLNLQQCHKLYEAIIKVLEMAIQSGGSSLKDYTRTNGEQGYFQHQFQVYDRENDKCLVCHHATINKTVQSNRSSYYCPTCQPLMALPEWS